MKVNYLFVILLVGALIRHWLSNSEYRKIIAARVEVSTPVNSWKRAMEAVFLEDQGVNPYFGDRFHEDPVRLWFYRLLLVTFEHSLSFIFIVSDMITTQFLMMFAKTYVAGPKEKLKVAIAAAYMLNPCAILNCVGFTTTVFFNMFLAAFLVAMVSGKVEHCTFFLAILISQNLNCVILSAPLILQFSKSKKIILLPAFWAIITFASYLRENNWNFFSATYGFSFETSDLRPNIGVLWYLFAEMFQQFQNLYMYLFQVNALFLHVVPLSIRFRKDPMFLTIISILLIALYKSYPCLGDVAFVSALLLCLQWLFKYSRQGFLIGLGFLMVTALAPIFWHLWIYAGSANANFYFAVTMAFAMFQVFLLTDVLYGYAKREYDLKHDGGWIPKKNFVLA